jgi:hypothetical protein
MNGREILQRQRGRGNNILACPLEETQTQIKATMDMFKVDKCQMG